MTKAEMTKSPYFDRITFPIEFKFDPDQPRDDHGRWGATGGAVAGILAGAAIGAARGGLAGAAVGAAVAGFVESGAAKAVAKLALNIAGWTVLPDWAAAIATAKLYGDGAKSALPQATPAKIEEFLQLLSASDLKRLGHDLIATSDTGMIERVFDGLLAGEKSSSPAVKFIDSSELAGAVQGYAATFGGQPDSYGDIIEPGAFAASLARHRAAGTSPLMLWAHDPDRPVGRWTSIEEDSHGLKVTGVFNMGTGAGRDAHAHVKAGDLNGLSIGYRVMPGGSHFSDRDRTTLLTELDVLEVSVVGFPANQSARISRVKSFGSRAELETILREHLPSRAVKKLLSGGWPAMSKEGGEDHPADEPSPETEHLAACITRATSEMLSLKDIFQ